MNTAGFSGHRGGAARRGIAAAPSHASRVPLFRMRNRLSGELSAAAINASADLPQAVGPILDALPNFLYGGRKLVHVLEEKRECPDFLIAERVPE